MNVERLRARLAQLETPRKAPRYFTEYDAWRVKAHLDKFCEREGLSGPYSGKRGGYVMPCPGAETHNHRERPDDCTLEYHHKANGFIFLYYNCRHNSCSDARREHSNALNQEWGKYLNEHYSA